MGFILLLLGLTTQPNSAVYDGLCLSEQKSPVYCEMQHQPYGIKYVTNGESVYQLRPVFWGGIYSVSKDGSPLTGDHCKIRNNDIYCLNTIIFITTDD